MADPTLTIYTDACTRYQSFSRVRSSLLSEKRLRRGARASFPSSGWQLRPKNYRVCENLVLRSVVLGWILIDRKFVAYFFLVNRLRQKPYSGLHSLKSPNRNVRLRYRLQSNQIAIYIDSWARQKHYDVWGPSYMVSGTRDNPPPELPWPR